MKQFVLGGLAAAAVAAFTLGVQAQDEDLSFKLDNDTGRAVARLAYVDPDGREHPLVLGVRPRERVTVSVADFLPGCRYDLVVNYADGGVDARSDVDLCALPEGVLSLS